MTLFPPKRVTNSAGEATVKSLWRSILLRSRPCFTRCRPDMLGLGNRRKHTTLEPQSLHTPLEPQSLHTPLEPQSLHTPLEPWSLHTPLEPKSMHAHLLLCSLSVLAWLSVSIWGQTRREEKFIYVHLFLSNGQLLNSN